MPQFTCATWRPIGTNIGGQMGRHRGVLMHQQVGYGSLFGYFNNPAAQVSAHFWISRSGVVEQYVDSSRVAWHARQLNGEWCGVECEGMPTDPLTDAQVGRFGEILAEGHRRHGWPLQLANSASGTGLGYHRMPGGVNTACPSDLRLSRRPEIVAAAGGSSSGGSAPADTWEDTEMIAATPTGKGYFTATRDGAVYAFGDAVFKGNAHGKVTGKVVGIASCAPDGYWLLASDGGVFAFGSAGFYGRPDRV